MGLGIFVSPLADGIEVLQGEAKRIHLLMAARTDRVLPVLLQPVANGGGLNPLAVLFQRRNVRRWRRRWRAQEILEDPFAPNHWGCPIRLGGHGENAALPEQAGTAIIPIG